MEELQTADLRDKRLEKRFLKLLDTLSQHSTASIPAACTDRSEMVAAYRFFDNPKIDFEAVLAPHIDATCERVAQQSVALLVQDTTELDLTRPTSKMEGAGPLHSGRRCGSLLHPLLAFTTDGTPLGSLYAEAWSRQDRTGQPKRSTNARHVANHQTPIEEKESYRWLETAHRCAEIKSHCPDTQLVMIADRESDIVDVLDYCTQQHDFDWVIRGGMARILAKTDKSEPSVPIVDPLREGEIRFEKTVSIRGRASWGSNKIKHRIGQADREAREASVAVQCGTVKLNDPRRHSGRKAEGIQVNAVLVSEIDPPKGAEPVQWLLLTSLPIKSKQQLETVIDYYEKRWVIELYFKVLKSGCRIESRRFEHIDRFLPALALYMIIAWRSLYVCRVSRTHEDSCCELIYSQAEWQSVWQIVKKKKPPAKPPGLMEMTKIVAQLGGYVNRKSAAPPGPQSMWIGLQRMHDFATCWLSFGPGAN